MTSFSVFGSDPKDITLSLQGESMAIIEAAVRKNRPASPAELLSEVRRIGRTPREAAGIIHADLDAR